ncbi:hypothetical protein CPB84DRAFT_1800179 [Gymnopilus junonius]|uniref:Uncharacterized protein n=1 Tax=Gymnopilus junonius TaxID=109634 RepID=A0A9P5N925_GYMJU|nr:hypothetical protein CPB84DRAFT_1800179 [Gymnopilus junonius]
MPSSAMSATTREPNINVFIWSSSPPTDFNHVNQVAESQSDSDSEEGEGEEHRLHLNRSATFYNHPGVRLTNHRNDNPTIAMGRGNTVVSNGTQQHLNDGPTQAYNAAPSNRERKEGLHQPSHQPAPPRSFSFTRRFQLPNFIQRGIPTQPHSTSGGRSQNFRARSVSSSDTYTAYFTDWNNSDGRSSNSTQGSYMDGSTETLKEDADHLATRL